MNTSITAILISTILIISGCGGGSQSVKVQPTIIDNFDLTQGNADPKKGREYLSEFLVEKNAQATTVENLYSRIDLVGLSDNHISGWTGKGITITVLDDEFNQANGHGRQVSDIVRVIAPGASRNEYTDNDMLLQDNLLRTTNSDIVTTSAGYAPTAVEADGDLKSYLLDFISDMKNSDAVFTVAAQHSNWSGIRDGEQGRGGFFDCNNNDVQQVEDCNTWAYYDLNSDNVIYVGEINGNDEIPSWSNQAGDLYKNQFIVTSSDVITTLSDGNPDGNSFAAPRVAGTAALVRQKFPKLNANETAVVILNTADDLGIKGVDNVYGHGKLNVGKALSPIGNLH